MSRSWTSQPVFTGGISFVRSVLRDSRVVPGFCCFFIALSLAGCGDSTSGKVTTSAPSAVAAPPGSSTRAVEPGQLGRAMGADGLPTLEPAKGVNVNVDSLFADDIKEPIDRIKRLENAVLELRRDYDATLPSIKRLVGIEKDMQTLMGQLETLTNGVPPSAGPAMEAVPVASVDSVPVPTDLASPQSPVPAPSAAAKNDPVPLVPAVPEARPMTTPKVETAAPSKNTEVAAIAPAPTSVPLPKTETAKAQAPPLPPSTAPPPQNANAPPPDIPKPPAASATAATSMPQQSGTVAAKGIAASGIRLGEDGGKTRLVIDLSGSVTHRTDLDNDEKILVIEIPDAGWTAPASKVLSSSVVQSYTTQPLENGKGTRLIITLKKPATILLDKQLPPEATNKNYRLVIDLKGK